MKSKGKGRKIFHKMLVTEKEFKEILETNGCKVEKIFRARNVSILWRVPFLKRKMITIFILSIIRYFQ